MLEFGVEKLKMKLDFPLEEVDSMQNVGLQKDGSQHYWKTGEWMAEER